jgi:hypothetical protein
MQSYVQSVSSDPVLTEENWYPSVPATRFEFQFYADTANVNNIPQPYTNPRQPTVYRNPNRRYLWSQTAITDNPTPPRTPPQQQPT